MLISRHGSIGSMDLLDPCISQQLESTFRSKYFDTMTKSKKRKTKKRSYDDALASLTDVLSKRETELETREVELQKAQEKFEAERSIVYGNTSPSDVIYLNIGGTKATVLRRTLTLFPESMLASKFSGRWDDSIEKDKDGCFFIDQDFDLFRPLLLYLRTKANQREESLLPPPTLSEDKLLRNSDFYTMVEYYGLTHEIYQTSLTVHSGSADLTEMNGPLKVDTKGWTTFKLDNIGHNRKIQSYEVTLGTVEQMRVGWMYDFNNSGYFGSSIDSIGVGDKECTMAIDMAIDPLKSNYLLNGSITPVDGVTYSEGCVVRSEDFGKKWYLNGVLVLNDTEEKHEKIVKGWHETAKESYDPSSPSKENKPFVQNILTP